MATPHAVHDESLPQRIIAATDYRCHGLSILWTTTEDMKKSIVGVYYNFDYFLFYNVRHMVRTLAMYT